MEDIPLLLLLVILSAIFSGLEIALFSLSEARLRSVADGATGRVKQQANRVLRIKQNPEKLLVTILIGNNLVNIGAASLATAVAIDTFGNAGIGLATGVMTLVILIVGEIIPKSLAQRNAAAIARWTSGLVVVLLYVLTPFSFFLELLAKLANKLTGGSGEQGISEEEVKAMVYMSSESGHVEADEREMIENIFNLDDVTAEDVMTQTTDVVSINVSLQAQDVLRIITNTGFSRFPVYAGNIDNLEGILYAKDLMYELAHNGGDITSLKIRELVKPAMFVPEQKPLDDLLNAFQRERKHIAIVVNEYGETRGLITLEDILEQIVGDITDEQDEDDKTIKYVNSKTVIVDADVDIKDIEQALDVTLSEEAHKSIAWFVLNELGEVPAKGDEFSFNNVKVIIEEAEEAKIKRVKLIKIR